MGIGIHIDRQPFQLETVVHPSLRTVDACFNSCADYVSTVTDPNLSPTYKKVSQVVLGILIAGALGRGAIKSLSGRQMLGLSLASISVSLLPLPHLIRQFACTKVSASDLKENDSIIVCFTPSTNTNSPAFIRGTVTSKTATELTLTHDDGSTTQLISDLAKRLTLLKEPSLAKLADSFAVAGLSPVNLLTLETLAMSAIVISMLTLGKSRIMKYASALSSSSLLFFASSQLLDRYDSYGWIPSAQKQIVSVSGQAGQDHLLTAHHGHGAAEFKQALHSSFPLAEFAATADLSLDQAKAVQQVLSLKLSQAAGVDFQKLPLTPAFELVKLLLERELKQVIHALETCPMAEPKPLAKRQKTFVKEIQTQFTQRKQMLNKLPIDSLNNDQKLRLGFCCRLYTQDTKQQTRLLKWIQKNDFLKGIEYPVFSYTKLTGGQKKFLTQAKAIFDKLKNTP